jgi:hypothetical protein
MSHNPKMVSGVVIAVSGTITDVSIPAKTSDVLDWIRKKYKNNNIQFQGKIQDPTKETRWLSIFASISDDDENMNQHMLPSPFDEETYGGPIIILATENDNQDDYEKSVSSYENLKPSEYETLYAEWTFSIEDDEQEELEQVDEVEDEVADIIADDIDIDDDEPVVNQVVHVARPIQVKTKNVFVECAIRDKVIENFTELLGDKSASFEEQLLKHIQEISIRDGI